jgi:hypothetical protein
MAAQAPAVPPDEPRADEDHTRVQVKNVNLQNCWRRGACSAEAILRAHGLFSADECNWSVMDDDGIDMFKPDGKNFVGLGAAADDDDDDEDGPADPQAAEAAEAAEADAAIDAGEDDRLIEDAIAEGAPSMQRRLHILYVFVTINYRRSPLIG